VKIKNALKFIMKILSSKKALLIPLGFILYYRMKNIPIEISTSQFLSMLSTNSTPIKDLKNFDDYSLLFTGPNDYQYISNIPREYLQTIYSQMIKRNISFNYLSGFRAFVENPLNQAMIIGAAFGLLLSMEFKSSVTNAWRRYNKGAVKGMDYYSNCIVKDSVKQQIKVIHDQLLNPQKYLDNRIKPIKGCLLYGPPGTGKTLLARVLYKVTYSVYLR
jgi:ATP-dependent Zn protease